MFQTKSSNIKVPFSASKLFLIFSITVSVILLCLILWKTNNFAQNNLKDNYFPQQTDQLILSNADSPLLNDIHEIVILFAVTFIILFILAAYFFGKSIRDTELIEKSHKYLQLEKNECQKTEIRLNQTHNELLTQSNQFNEIITIKILTALFIMK